MKITVVVPTIRESCAQQWLREWEGELEGARIIFVEDNPEKSFQLSGDIEHYAWDDVARELGDRAWIIPRRTSACRSFGFLKALESDTEIIWTTDDDCYPEERHRGNYLTALAGILSGEEHGSAWFNTIEGTGLYPRGYPYGIRNQSSPVMLHHGLWSNVPDLDGITQLENPDFRLPPAGHTSVIPYGKLFPMCIMNVAFRREMTPLLYMLLQGKDQDGEPWGYDRFDDIWGGVFMKLAADHLGYAVTSGSPGVHHSRASDPRRNAELEAAGMKTHEGLWRHLEGAGIDGDSPSGCYLHLADIIGGYWGASPRPGYWCSLAQAMRVWVRETERRM